MAAGALEASKRLRPATTEQPPGRHWQAPRGCSGKAGCILQTRSPGGAPGPGAAPRRRERGGALEEVGLSWKRGQSEGIS